MFEAILDEGGHDANMLDALMPEPGVNFVLEEAYLGYGLLFCPHQNVTLLAAPAKANTRLKCLNSKSVDKFIRLRCDQIVFPTRSYMR